MGDKCLSISVDQTMPLLIFGGPYSNLQALTALKNVADELRIPKTQVICTGDVVAYCAHPEEAIQLCMDWGIHVVMGNCEEQLATRQDNCACGFEEGSSCAQLSENWYQYADANISEKGRAWMGNLPERIIFNYSGKDICVVHGSYQQINKFIFPSSSLEEKKKDFLTAKADIIIGGHSGIPFIEKIEDNLWYNPGVIGMPANDGTPDTWYGLVRPLVEGIKFSIHRLQYNYNIESEIMQSKGFADPYAAALKTGLWPSLDILPQSEAEQTAMEIKEIEVIY